MKCPTFSSVHCSPEAQPRRSLTPETHSFSSSQSSRALSKASLGLVISLVLRRLYHLTISDRGSGTFEQGARRVDRHRVT